MNAPRLPGYPIPQSLFQPQRARSPAAAPVAAYCVWLNGELLPYDEAEVALVPVATGGTAGVFEEIRCYQTERGPAIFRLRDHLQRFLSSIRLLGIHDLRYTIQELQQAANAAVHANNFHACHIRPILYHARDASAGGGEVEPVVAVAAWEQAPEPEQGAGELGARARTAPRSELDYTAGLPIDIGSDWYAGSVLARQGARVDDVDEAILLDSEGTVTDSTGENLFLVQDGTIYTPPPGEMPARVARDTLLTLARDLGLPVVEKPLVGEDLATADELFFCSTVAEVTPIVSLDGRSIGDGHPGPIVRTLRERYADTVRGRREPAYGWLEYVMMEPLY